MMRKPKENKDWVAVRRPAFKTLQSEHANAVLRIRHLEEELRKAEQNIVAWKNFSGGMTTSIEHMMVGLRLQPPQGGKLQ